MTAKQMEMYISGAYEKDMEAVKAYEVQQYRKAFATGTKQAWATYRRNVTRKQNAFNQVYGLGLNVMR